MNQKILFLFAVFAAVHVCSIAAYPKPDSELSHLPEPVLQEMNRNGPEIHTQQGDWYYIIAMIILYNFAMAL